MTKSCCVITEKSANFSANPE